MFMTAATQLLSSIKETKRQQNFDIFGERMGAPLSAAEEAKALLAQYKTLGAQFYVSRIIAKSSQAGVIGVINDELFKIGRLKTHAGLCRRPNEPSRSNGRAHQTAGSILYEGIRQNVLWQQRKRRSGAGNGRTAVSLAIANAFVPGVMCFTSAKEVGGVIYPWASG